MWQLDYARDNRLRLWFLGLDGSKQLDEQVSPSEETFLQLMAECFTHWKTLVTRGDYCVLILGDTYCRSLKQPLPKAITFIATQKIGGYCLAWEHCEKIPTDRRVRRSYRGNRTETILALRRI